MHENRMKSHDDDERLTLGQLTNSKLTTLPVSHMKSDRNAIPKVESGGLISVILITIASCVRGCRYWDASPMHAGRYTQYETTFYHFVSGYYS